jgi:hypothetical protein
MQTDQRNNEVAKVCDRLKSLGYARSSRIRIYGEELDVVSDPFPQADGIAVKTVSPRDKQTRTIQLPRPVLQMADSKSSDH